MTKKTALSIVMVICWAAIAAGAQAAEPTDIALPAPRMEGGKPLLQALKERQSARAFSAQKLPLQLMADLLWAAAGINRPGTGHRTAPSAWNAQEIDIYVFIEDGTFLYDPKANLLKLIKPGDQRRLAGMQDFVATAPLSLVYVADTSKMRDATPDDQTLVAGVATGAICQNVYLFCASEGLATVARGSVDRLALAVALNFPAHQKVILGQTVGYPAASKP